MHTEYTRVFTSRPRESGRVLKCFLIYLMLPRAPSSTLIICSSLFFFFFNDTATTEIYTLSLHDALPIWCGGPCADGDHRASRIIRSRTTTRWGSSSASPIWRTRSRTRSASMVWPCRVSRRSEEHTSELQSRSDLVCRLLL